MVHASNTSKLQLLTLSQQLVSHSMMALHRSAIHSFLPHQLYQTFLQYNHPMVTSTRRSGGSFKGYIEIEEWVSKAYDKIIKWKRNLFMTPSGKAGKDVAPGCVPLPDMSPNRYKLLKCLTKNSTRLSRDKRCLMIISDVVVT